MPASGQRRASGRPPARRQIRTGCRRQTTAGRQDVDRGRGGPARTPQPDRLSAGGRGFCPLPRPRRMPTPPSSSARRASGDEDRHRVVADLDEAAVRRRSRCTRAVGQVDPRLVLGERAEERRVAGQEGDLAPPSVRVITWVASPVEQHLLGRHDLDLHRVAMVRQRLPAAPSPWPAPARRRRRSGTPARAPRRARR